MKTIKGTIKEDFGRDLFWTRIVFLNDDESKKSQLLTCASEEYLEDTFRISGREQLTEEHKNEWLKGVIEKWSSVGEEIFNEDIHYDVYANTKEGEANGLDYLLTKAQSR